MGNFRYCIKFDCQTKGSQNIDWARLVYHPHTNSFKPICNNFFSLKGAPGQEKKGKQKSTIYKPSLMFCVKKACHGNYIIQAYN